MNLNNLNIIKIIPKLSNKKPTSNHFNLLVEPLLQSTSRRGSPSSRFGYFKWLFSCKNNPETWPVKAVLISKKVYAINELNGISVIQMCPESHFHIFLFNNIFKEDKLLSTLELTFTIEVDYHLTFQWI